MQFGNALYFVLVVFLTDALIDRDPPVFVICIEFLNCLCSSKMLQYDEHFHPQHFLFIDDVILFVFFFIFFCPYDVEIVDHRVKKDLTSGSRGRALR